MVDAYISIGSNIDTKKNIEKCLQLLKKEFDVVAQSPYYETKPYGYEKQSNFINLAVKIKTELKPYELFKALQQIENNLGRKRIFRFNPRTIDLDILLYGDKIVNDKDLIIPHKGLLERDFMFIPLLDIAPNVVYTIAKKKIKYLKNKIKHHQILRKIELND